MPTLDDVARHQTALEIDDLAWLHRLVADWQIVADLSFADLVLWLPDRDGKGFWAAAQMRPTTAPTAYVDDVAGAFVPTGRRPMLDTAWEQGRIVREGDPEWRDDVPVRVETIPVRRGGRLLGVIARNTNLLGVRTPSRLELAYLQTAAELTTMISLGRFPGQAERSELADDMRVGDGFVRVGLDGRVAYASPNATSAFRRLGLAGDLVGADLPAVTAAAVAPSAEPVDEAVGTVLAGRIESATVLETGRTSLVVRSIPLAGVEGPTGALILLRDVTDLRRRERELVTKDATIREIHHRVKNNLQTVAALLRLQARRVPAEEARSALDEAVRRVGAIAIVHELLSHTIDEQVVFDEVVDRLQATVAEIASPGAEVVTRRVGSFGLLPAQVATALALVLTELIHNAVEHGLGSAGGQIEVLAVRTPHQLRIEVRDDGVGTPPGFDPAGLSTLGLSIVRTLCETELNAALAYAPAEPHGTVVSLQLPVG